MRIAGGVIALIAGIFGFIAAVATLFFGGVGAAFSANGADTVLRYGWGGIAFSFLVIVYGACALGTKGRWAGYLLIVSAIGGWFLGGLLVGICMVLAVIGGVLSLLQARSVEEHAKQSKTAVVVAIIPLLIVAALSVESIYEAKRPAEASENAVKVTVPTPIEKSEASPAGAGGVSVGNEESRQVSCKSIPVALWNSIQGAGSISRGITECGDVNIVSRGDVDGDGKPDVAAVWSSESSCADSPDQPSGSCGNNVVQFVSVQLGTGKIIPPIKLSGSANGMKVTPAGLDVDVLKYGSDDPRCCPSVKATVHLALRGAELVGIDSASDGSGRKESEGKESSAATKKCALAADTAYQAAQIRFDSYATNEDKVMRLMQGGASADLAGALLSFATTHPADSSELLKQVVMDDCLKGDPRAIDHDPRLHSMLR
jgi:hypothetical protein